MRNKVVQRQDHLTLQTALTDEQEAGSHESLSCELLQYFQCLLLK